MALEGRALRWPSMEAVAKVLLTAHNDVYRVAISIGVAMPLLGHLGFQPAGAMTDTSRHALEIVGLYLPAVLMVAGAVVLWGYPIDAKAHGEIRRQLEPA